MPSEKSNGQADSTKTIRNLDWPTVVLIILSGGTNFFATQRNSTDREYQVQQAINQIRALHDSLDETEEWQKKAIANQNKLLDNQSKILEHDTVLLQEVHEITRRFDKGP